DSVSETLSGEPLSLDTIRRLCCDAEIRLVTLAGASERIDVDRQDRVANRAQRRALAALHRTCAHPDCDVMFEHCQIHHVTPWEHGGLTNLDNLIPLCTRHHHLVHEGRWTLTLRSDRAVIWTRPDGVTHYEGYTTDRYPNDRVYVPEPDPPSVRQP
ncbi:MAG: HNH endonuclease signature motif containing protein, partial [Ilumatobacteraceae bacterium]